MSSFEQEPKTNQSDTDEHQEDVLPAQTSVLPTKKEKSYWLSFKTGGIVVVGLLIFLYSILDFEDPKKADEAQALNAISFDERLIACNALTTSAPSPQYDTCLSAAQDGEVLAIKRLIWAYSRQSESQDLGKVFDWLRALPYKDDATQLLMFSLVHLNTKSDTLRKDSELGISRLVAKNYPPANVVLASIYALSENVAPPSSNTIWLLNRAHNKDPMSLDASMLALIHANGFVSQVDLEAATATLKNAAQANFPMMTNNIAWFLATLDNNPFAPAEYAVSLANSVTNDPEHGQNHIYVDTLAATLAANSQFDKAIETQNMALALLADENYNENIMLQTQKSYEQRRSLYTNNEVIIETSLSTDKNVFFKSIRNRVLEYVLRDFFIPIETPASFLPSPSPQEAETVQGTSQ